MGRNSKLKEARRAARKKGMISTDALQPNTPGAVYQAQGANDLFENPMAKAALAALSDEDREKYRIIGEHLYNRIDFQSGKVLDNTPEGMAEAVAFIEDQLRSGMHPSMLEDNEKALMAEILGKEWYTKWGYVEGDLMDIITVKFENPEQ